MEDNPLISMEQNDDQLLHTLFFLIKHGSAKELKQIILQNQSVACTLLNMVDDAKLSCLHQAARRHDIECVKTLVEDGCADVNLRVKYDLTPLHFAAKYKHGQADGRSEESLLPLMEHDITEPSSEIFDEVIHYLCLNEAYIDCSDANGMTPLHYAASRNNIPALNQLIALKADMECTDHEKMTPLLLAAREEQLQAMIILLNFGANAFAVDQYGWNIVHHICHNGHTEALTFIQTHFQNKHDSDSLVKMLNSRNKEGETPVHLAAANLDEDIMDMCIKSGADLSIQTYKKKTMLHLAARGGNNALIELLLKRGLSVNAVDSNRRTPLFVAIKHYASETTEFLLQNGADIEHMDAEGLTPLLLCSKIGYVEICRILLQHNASMNAEDNFWRTPMHLAVIGNHCDIVELLIEKSTKPKLLLEKEDIEENRPIHVAVQNGNVAITQLLMKKGVKLHAKNASEQTPLHVAAVHGHLSIAKLLLDENLFLAFERDENGNFPIHLAAEHGFPQMLKYLLDWTSQLDEQNAPGWTPLMLASEHNHLDCVELLIKEGANVNAFDKSKFTALFLACRNNHIDIVKLLLDAGADPGCRVSQNHTEYPGWNALDIAVHANHFPCAEAILEGKMWRSAMRNETYEYLIMYKTPLLRMIERMPAAAELALSRCIEHNKEQKTSDDYTITFDFEFLDDCPSLRGVDYQSFLKQLKLLGQQTTAQADRNRDGVSYSLMDLNTDIPQRSLKNTEETLAQTDDKPMEDIEEVFKSSRTHPLKYMHSCSRENLLKHPLVLALLSLKWTRLCFLYYSLLLLYVLFVCLFTSFMLQTQPPYMLDPEGNRTNSELCELLRSTHTKAYQLHIGVPKYGVLVLCVVFLILEILKFIRICKTYFNLENILRVTIFTLAICTTIDLNRCMYETGLRATWQWIAGSIGIVLAWVNLLLFIQALMKVGLYVIMFVAVMHTLVKCFLVFAPFLIGFAIAFHVTLANQNPFKYMTNSIVKTMAMITGELDTGSTLFERFESTEVSKRVYFEGVSYVGYMIFISLMTIALSNLLVGLAVGDTEAVKRRATLARQGMLLKQLLEAEELISMFGSKPYSVPKYEYKPNSQDNLVDIMFHQAYKQSTKTLKEVAELKQDDDEAEEKTQEHTLKGIQTQIAKLSNQMSELIDRVDSNKSSGSAKRQSFESQSIHGSENVIPGLNEEPDVDDDMNR